MTKKLTNVVTTEPFSIGDAAKATRFDFFTLENFICPIILFDHVHMRAAGFPPHPHAGLAVFSYLMDDSRGQLRDRDSLNPELLVDPGDLLWFQMASGMIHEENPAVEHQEIDQMQVWINLSPASQKLPPATMLLKSRTIPRSPPAAPWCGWPWANSVGHRRLSPPPSRSPSSMSAPTRERRWKSPYPRAGPA